MRFQVICPVHGLQVVPPPDLFLDLELDTYRFRCMDCGEWVVKDADDTVRDLLLCNGALVDFCPRLPWEAA